jgi:effector-binding domain-containing protein
MARGEFSIEEKELDTILAAGIRYTGAYSECGKAFGKIGRTMGRHICGKPFNLYYDDEYREHDADIESCMPVRTGASAAGVVVRELPGGRCVSLLHKGPYDTIGRSYEKVLAYIKDKGYAARTPSREIYHKGPGMIFKGNPDKYLTEIQILVD